VEPENQGQESKKKRKRVGQGPPALPAGEQGAKDPVYRQVKMTELLKVKPPQKALRAAD
jgi:hypothetical protein